MLANAGHLPPYLNGEPMKIEGSLPLGMVENHDCSVFEFRLSPSDRLLLVSDGVPEATNDQGKLFGFDRVLELVRTQSSAAGIAETPGLWPGRRHQRDLGNQGAGSRASLGVRLFASPIVVGLAALTESGFVSSVANRGNAFIEPSYVPFSGLLP